MRTVHLRVTMMCRTRNALRGIAMNSTGLRRAAEPRGGIQRGVSPANPW